MKLSPKKLDHKLKNIFVVFCFPLTPLKTFSTPSALLFLSILIALRLVLQRFSIFLPIFGMVISVAWTPLIIIGWVYGPVIGFFTGVITDTIAFFVWSHSLWFWMYAIQEPLVACLSGIFASCFRFFNLINNKKKMNLVGAIFFQCVIIGFMAICFYFLLNFNNKTRFEGSSKVQTTAYEWAKWVIVGTLVFFFLFFQIVFFFFFVKKKQYALYILAVVTLVCSISIIFSFLLGPYTYFSYYSYLHNGNKPNAFFKYGTIFYLIPRAIRESIKAPFQASIIYLGVVIVNSAFIKMKNMAQNKWNK